MPRLPQPGGDNGSWGAILNDYLSQAHKPDGSLKDSVVQESHLALGVQTKLNQTTPTWETISGKPTVVASGVDAATARGVISARRASRVPSSNGVDDRNTIQALLESGAKEIVFESGGEWIIDTDLASGRLMPLSDTRIIIEEGAVLKVKPNASTHGRLFDLQGVHNVTIEGAGTLLGDVETHSGLTGQWGHLINIGNGCSNILITGPMLLKHAWGDGIYIGGTAISYNVVIDGVTVEDCRREGIAPFWVEGCVIRNCKIIDIGKTANVLPEHNGGHGGPGSGIDVEPNSGETVNYLTIENNYIRGTAGCGMYISSNPGPVTNLIVRNNEVVSCGLTTDVLTTYQTNGIHIASVARPILLNNVIRGSGYDGNINGTSGQLLLRGTIRPVVRGGYIYGGAGRGIYAMQCTAPEISNISIQQNMHHAILAYQSHDTIIRDNQILDNVQSSASTVEHISLQGSNNSLVQNNVLRGDKGNSWVRVEGSGDDNLIVGNIGLGSPPAAVLVDEGTRTVKSGNIRKSSTVFAPWTVDDVSSLTPSRSYADLLGWTYDPATILSGTILPAAATIYFGRIPLSAPVLVTNVVLNLSTLGVNLSNAFVALFDSSGTVLGQSADQSTTWQTGGVTGLKTIPLTSPVNITPQASNDFVWVAIYVGSGDTLPAFARGVTGNSGTLNAGTSSLRRRYASLAQSSTASLTSVTPSSMSAASVSFWLAIS